jgi:beta-phosphoglucomutase-like phosphatase (HAD superfamily)
VVPGPLRWPGSPRPDCLRRGTWSPPRRSRGGKPAPDPYQQGARLLHLPPSDCLAIEDAPAGLRSATAAGCQTLALITTHAPSDLAGATLMAENLGAVEIELHGDEIEVIIEQPDAKRPPTRRSN